MARYSLYYYPGNASLAPHMVLRELGVSFELRLVDRAQWEQRSPEYLRINPRGKIPSLTDGEITLTESPAICLVLAERHRDHLSLIPEAGAARATALQWLMFLTNTLQPVLMSLHYPEEVCGPDGPMTAVRDRAVLTAGALFTQVDGELARRPYVGGTTLTVCDHFFLMLARWGRRLSEPPHAYPHVRRLLEELVGRPAIRETFDAEGIAAPFYAEPAEEEAA